jgi:glutamyl/glutaminyl-tRNA synthetase
LPAFRKTRLAPTPSGLLHLGNVYSFALTAALAKKTGAAILLRIDDLDQERVQPAYVQDVFDTLRFMRIPWQEGPENAEDFEWHYSQLKRMHLYQQALEQLKESGLVYACTCSRAQVARSNTAGTYPGTCRHRNLPLESKEACWRLNTERAGEIIIKNINGIITKAVFPGGMQDFVVRKKDGFPAYQLASLVDDVHFGIDLVVRGEDLWPSTLVQLHLASLLGLKSFTQAAFYHHPLIMTGPDKKLSKSAGDTSIHYLRQHGATSEAIYEQLGRELLLNFVPLRWEDFVTAV